MSIKIKMIRDGELHYHYGENTKSKSQVQTQSPSDLVSDPEELKIRRILQQLKAELRQQELEEIKRKYLGEH